MLWQAPVETVYYTVVTVLYYTILYYYLLYYTILYYTILYTVYTFVFVAHSGG